MLEVMAPSCLSISPWRVTGTPFGPISLVSERSQSGPVYSFDLQQAFPGKGKHGSVNPPKPALTQIALDLFKSDMS